MDIKLYTHLPEKEESFLSFVTELLKLPLEEASKLYFYTFRIKALSDIPIYKFLERAISYIKFDEIGKKEFLLTLSVYSIRQLLIEHFDLKFTKNLYVYLQNRVPHDFFRDCAPKREVVTSRDLSFHQLTLKEKAELPPYLKVKHIILHFLITGKCEEILKVVNYLQLFTIADRGDKVELYVPQSLSDFVYLSQEFHRRRFFEPLVLEVLMKQLRGLFPDCFGEI